MRLKGNSGITLTEMMVSMAIFTFIIAGVYSTLYVGNVSWAIQDASVNVQGQARRAIGRMTRDLRVAQNLVITQDADNVDISFTRPGEGAITYAWTTGAGATQNQLIRTDDDGAAIAAQNISALTLTETASDVKIDLTVSAQSNLNQTVGYSLVGNVALR